MDQTERRQCRKTGVRLNFPLSELSMGSPVAVGTPVTRRPPRSLSDTDLLASVTNPANGDFVTVNTRTGGVVDGNTRVTELQRRAADSNSTISGNTLIPVKPYTPDNSDFPDLK